METHVTVAAVMTAPRFECVWARNQIERALAEAGIPLTISGGVYYGQCMQAMLESVVDSGTKYALTVDFDSIFTANHVRRLISIIEQEEQIDALAAIQPMCGKGRTLGAKRDGDKSLQDWNGYPLPMRTAHFGLTVIDCAKLRDVPQPWFHGRPNEDGRWGDGCIDDDVSFWMNWERAGNSVYIDPGSRLGHLEEMITIFDPEMNLEHLYPTQWEERRDSAVD